jgi:hypothetical protein
MKFSEYVESFSYVDKKLYNDAGVDAKAVSTSLPNGFANGFQFDNNLSDQAVLSLEAIRMCDGSEGDLADFLTAVQYFVERYKQAGVDFLRVTHTDLKDHLHLTDSAVARAGYLILGESILCSSFAGPAKSENKTWECTLVREVRRFDGVASIEDYLERRNKERKIAHQQVISQLLLLLGYMYRKPNTEDIEAGIAPWSKNLTEPNTQGEKLEVALLNALARLGVPVLFGGDLQGSGPATPRYDLVALNFGAPPMQRPTAVLISCKSTTNQPQRTEIALLSDESSKVRTVLPEWQVFGAFVTLGEPTADEFNYRQDVRIWKQSHLQALLHAKEQRSMALFLWTPPWVWDSDREIMWWNTYRA